MKLALSATAVIAVFAASASAVCGPVSEKTAKVLASYEPTDETRSCLSLRRIDQITPVSETQFLVEAGNDYYLTDIEGSCDQALKNYTRIEYETTLSSLCANEIIRVVDQTSGTYFGSCTIGEFVKLKKKTDAEAGADA